jgi:hypothetical protein
MFFTFPENARWNADRQAVEFGVEIGEYSGVVRVPRRVFQRLLPERPTPERASRRITSSEHGSRASPSRKLRRRQVDRGWERRDQRARLALSRRWELSR